MCRNITNLRGLEPEASEEERQAAARQYVRKVGGVQAPSRRTDAAVERAVARVAEATNALLGELPARRNPPLQVPPLRRLREAPRAWTDDGNPGAEPTIAEARPEER